MTLIAHPLTQLNGSPQYTADNYRKAVNALLTPSDGTAFGTVSGVRAGSPSPLLSISGTTVTVKPHAGVICPWTGVGAYTYALDAQATVNVTDSTGTYKIALVLSDPSQSHGSAPGIALQSFPASTANSSINGLVIGQVAAGTASDTAPRILQQTMITVPTLAILNSLTGVEGQKASVTSDGTAMNNTEYQYRSGAWVAMKLSGFYEGVTNANGMVTINVPWQPSLVFLQAATIDDDNRRFWYPVLFGRTASSFTVREVDLRNQAYTGQQGVKFFWQAQP